MPETTKRERLFNKARRTKTVTLANGDTFEIRPLSLAERTKLVKDCRTDGEVDTEKLVPAIVIACTYDGPEATAPVFTIGDREAIDAMPAVEIDPFWTAAAELNGLSETAVKKAEED